MTVCNRPDCGRGEIDDQGFCTACARRQGPPTSTAEHAGAHPPAPQRTTPAAGVAAVRPNPWYGLELAEPLEAAGRTDDLPPTASSSRDPVTERERHCSDPRCQAPVGRGYDRSPGRIHGYCPRCGARFDFRVPVGKTVAERYVIEGRLGSGSNGTAYLAYDNNLQAYVVLKALTGSVARTAEHERDALVDLRHDNIVRILDYEAEGPYLVLEYVPGVDLSELHGADRLAVLLGHGIRILQALDHLHAKGLLHCDVKPSNIIRFPVERGYTDGGEGGEPARREGVRLIDFGSVRKRNATGPIESFTPDYAPRENDPEWDEPTVGFDLFSLGVTLKRLCHVHLDNLAAPGVESLQFLVDRATDSRVPKRRFATARQFGEQLSGVIRQVAAGSPQHAPVVRASALFGSMPKALHGGLGAARPIRHWVGAKPDDDARLTMPAAFRTPDPRDVAMALPAPLQVPDDPDITESSRAALAESQRALRTPDTAGARTALEQADLPTWHWLKSWYTGLIALADGENEQATRHFTAVRKALPGELIPQLALGLCAEISHRASVAQSCYSTVFDTSPALGAAGFGLARVHLRAGRRMAAVATVDRLADVVRYGPAARIAAIRLLIVAPAEQEHPGPGSAEVAQARARRAEIVDRFTADSLDAEIRYADFLRTGDTDDRLALSRAIQELAAHATNDGDHTALLDGANHVRPPVPWPWSRHGRIGLFGFKRKTQPLSS